MDRPGLVAVVECKGFAACGSTTGDRIILVTFAARRRHERLQGLGLTNRRDGMKGRIAALAVAGALMLAGCGGGSKSASMAGGPSPTPTPTPPPTPTFGPGSIIPLPQGHTLQTGTITIPADESLPVREADNEKTVIRCSAGSENCRITVAADGTVTLIAGSLRIEIQGVPVVTTPPIPPVQVETPPTPPTMVYESPLVSWRELPALVDRYDHWTHMQVGVHTPRDRHVTTALRPAEPW